MAIEPPPVIQRSPESQALLDLAAATSRVDAAWEAYHAADVARLRAEDEYELARRDLARAMAAVRETMALPDVEPEPELPAPIPFASGGHSQEIVDDAPEIVVRRPDPTATPAAAFAAFARDRVVVAEEPPVLSTSQERVVRAVTKAGGSLSAAAAALGTSTSSVATALRHIGAKGGIPIELIPLLPAGYAKYRPAGL